MKDETAALLLAARDSLTAIQLGTSLKTRSGDGSSVSARQGITKQENDGDSEDVLDNRRRSD